VAATFTAHVDACVSASSGSPRRGAAASRATALGDDDQLAASNRDDQQNSPGATLFEHVADAQPSTLLADRPPERAHVDPPLQPEPQLSAKASVAIAK
jgi:hypothetical protein